MVECYIAGAKGISFYGGYESFVQKLLQYHKDNDSIHYHVACKANGDGAMKVDKLEGASEAVDNHFTYCNAECHLITVPEKLGPAQAIAYDIKALNMFCEDIEKKYSSCSDRLYYSKQYRPDQDEEGQSHNEKDDVRIVVYILACRIGPFISRYVKKIHKLGGKVYINPDGHEWKRAKWSAPVRRYWKLSEKLMVKHADLVICDSVNIEKYIHESYDTSEKKVNTTYIAYGAEVKKSPLSDDDMRYTEWMADKGLASGKYYMICCRAVPENNFETIIREFMRSNTKRNLAIITTDNPELLAKLEEKLHYSADSRIKFVGTVYDSELLTKIRENAYGYIHGHSVGGTNPTLLEALGSTNLNLLYDVGFNREVARDAALYWSLDDGNLAGLIGKADNMIPEEIEQYGIMAKKRITEAYSWQHICDSYAKILGDISYENSDG